MEGYERIQKCGPLQIVESPKELHTVLYIHREKIIFGARFFGCCILGDGMFWDLFWNLGSPSENVRGDVRLCFTQFWWWGEDV